MILPVARVKKAKYAALALLAAITLAAPIVETLVTGRVESFSAYDMGATFVSLLPGTGVRAMTVRTPAMPPLVM